MKNEVALVLHQVADEGFLDFRVADDEFAVVIHGTVHIEDSSDIVVLFVLAVQNEQVAIVGKVISEKNIEAVKVKRNGCSLCNSEWI